MPGSDQRGAVWEKKSRKYSQDRQLHISLKETCNGPMCLANNDLTWSLNKHGLSITINKLRTTQSTMERKMFALKLQDKIPCSEIRKRTKIIDIREYTLKQKWRRTTGGPNAAQSGNQGEGRDQEDNQAEDGKTT